ncbi:hypothetical protein [uncultured Winogradskyella sp.]|uniref:hypothetical protein n=1 Tax=uncultured Winogradskyella sp. TaxID=395353 RepID=UPI00260AA425|nr:hypothetical protein [uncultured Winogradskyella sp.]
MEDDILIERYLKGLLSKDEEKSFLDRLDSDTDFSEKFKLEEQLFNSLNENSWSFSESKNAEVNDYAKLLREEDLQNLKKTLAKTSSEFNSKEGATSKRLFYYLAAASIVIFLGFQLFVNENTSNQDLYNDYIALNDLPSFVTRGNDTSDLARAQELFENKKYEESLSVFQSIDNLSNNEANLAIYKGIAQTELGKYDEAEHTFNTLINSDLLDAEKGYWYKALLFIKRDRIQEAKSTLKEIVSKSLSHKDKAVLLLDDLD